MQSNRSKVTGVVLAGGRARRMENKDKGLIQFKGIPLVCYAINALKPAVNNVIINANRNQDTYSSYGYPVVRDITDSYDGPLAGILSALKTTETPFLLSVPCDCPLIQTQQIIRMVDGIIEQEADAAVAWDGERMHPVFLILRTTVTDSLENYLAGGERKIDTWLFQLNLVKIDFTHYPEMFKNINTPDQLKALETEYDGRS